MSKKNRTVPRGSAAGLRVTGFAVCMLFQADLSFRTSKALPRSTTLKTFVRKHVLNLKSVCDRKLVNCCSSHPRFRVAVPRSTQEHRDYRLLYASSGVLPFRFYYYYSFYQDLCPELSVLPLISQRYDSPPQSRSGPRFSTNHTAVTQAAQRAGHL